MDQHIVYNEEARMGSYVAVVIIVSYKRRMMHETGHRTGNRQYMTQMT